MTHHRRFAEAVALTPEPARKGPCPTTPGNPVQAKRSVVAESGSREELRSLLCLRAEVTWRRESSDDAPGRPALVDSGRELPQHDPDMPFALGLELLMEAIEARLSVQRRSAGR